MGSPSGRPAAVRRPRKGWRVRRAGSRPRWVRRCDGGDGPYVCVSRVEKSLPANRRFSRLILSRAGLTPARDKINLEKLPTRLKALHCAGKCHPYVFPESRPAAPGMLPCKSRHRNPSRAPTPAGIRLPLPTGMCPCRPARAGSPHTRSFIHSPTQTRPPTYTPVPTPEVEERERAGAARSRRKERVRGGAKAVQSGQGL